MEATTTRKKTGLVKRAALVLAPVLLAMVLGGVWAGWRIAESAQAGTLDLSLGGFFVKVDRGGPAQAPRRLSVGFRIGPPSRPANPAL